VSPRGVTGVTTPSEDRVAPLRCCKVPDCAALDATVAPYFQRLRLCPAHAHAPALLLDGALLRFCQKCNKLHPLADFEGQKRACAAQLLRHNQARREAHRKRSARSGRSSEARGIAPTKPAPCLPLGSVSGLTEADLVLDDMELFLSDLLASESVVSVDH